MTPTKIGRYEIKAELGRGGMATVYRAYDPSFDREVAIKVLPKEFLHDPNFHDRFKREIKVIAALEHPAIVPVHDAGEEDGVPYFVMRYMPGGSLSNQIARGRFSMQDAARIIERLASALAYAHKKGIVHRDLKPDNILFDSNGDPYISDFGVASLATAPTNLTGTAAIGTPAYMSPEQAQGDKVDNRSDIYGLGVIIFQMLSGKQPYDADTPMGVAFKHITDPVPEILKVNPTLPKETDTIIKTAMAKKREERYPTATELAKAFLQAAGAGSEAGVSRGVSVPASSAEAASSRTSASATSGRNRTLMFAGIAVVGVVAVLIIVAAGAFFLRDRLFAGKPESTASAVAEAPGAAATATVQPESNPAFFTEDFNGDVANWERLIAGGSEDLMTLSIENGFQVFDLQGKEMRIYTYYAPQTYDNVRIDVRAENRGEISSVTMFCRYNEDKGWYEFNVASNGLFQILYTSWNADRRDVSHAVVADGASNRVHQGNEINEYSAVCKGRILSLFANGSEVRTVEDNRFLLTDGYAGIGVASSARVPAVIGIDSVSFNQP